MENIIELNPIDTPTIDVTAKFAGTNRHPQAVAIRPGNTTADVLRHLGLDEMGFSLSDHENNVLGPDENLYGRLAHGGLVHVTSVVDAGASTQSFSTFG